jgi:DNA ligase-1
MNVDEQIFYYQDASGAIRYWSIEIIDYDLIMEFGVLGGAAQHQIESIEYGLGGRSREEQALSRFESRINNKRDKGYVNTIEEAKSSRPTNMLGLLKPMLAHKHQDYKDKIEYSGAYLQYKYDGHRCLVTKQNGKLIAYSRNGKEIDSIPHILEGIEIEEGVYLDGELYVHGLPLQKISSLVKRHQTDSEKIVYHVYDTISNVDYSERLDMLRGMVLGERAIVVPTWEANETEIPSQLEKAISDGYEGLILRLDGYGYEDSKRSKGLLKVKQFHDDEFLVVDINPSVDGYGILTCVMDSGKTFNATAPGDMTEKKRALREKGSYIGRSVTVKYANFTKDGIPFHPIAVCWRNKAEE